MFAFRILRSRRLCSRLFLLLLVAGSMVASDFSGPALAQEVRQRRGLLDWLFGGQRRQQQVQPDIIELPARKKPRNKKRTQGSVTTLTTQPAPIAKNPDARHVLVVGDFLASGLSEGLQASFEQDATTVIDSRTNASSGLVRDDYYDWPTNLGKALEELKPTAVVVIIGSNDRQQMRIGSAKEKFGTPAWDDAYTQRVQGLIKVAGDRHVPLIWVGLPAFDNDQTSSAALQFNTVYRNETARAGAEFVDIWDGFVDENGKFIVTGSDINGQPVRLRTSDGVGMTAAGKRKMAFYAEKPLRKVLGDPLTVEKLIRLDSDGLLGPEANAAKSGPPVRTPPISLTDPELDGGNALLGDRQAAAVKSILPALPDKPPAGRVDDYSQPAL